MASIFLVWLIGLGLILAEFYFPGGVLALTGAGALGISLLMGYQAIESPWIFTFWLVLVAGSVYVVIRLALWRLQQAGEGTLIQSQSQKGYAASHYDHELIGKKALVVSDLRPAGWIEYEGRRLAAVSDVGLITKGKRVVIVSGEGSDLIVRESHE